MQSSFRKNLAASIGLALIMGMTSSYPASAQEDKVIATLNGQQITEADMALAEEQLGAQFGRLPEAERRVALLSALIDLKLLANAAVEQKIDESDEFKQQQEFLRNQALHSAFIEKNVIEQITDDEVKARYDEEVKKLTMPEEVHARHILVESEDEAKAIIKQLDDGGNFEEIAKEKSKDGAAANGGDLGYFTKGRMVPEFETAAFAMESGSYSKEPIKTQFGWHVLKVDDKRQQPAPTLEQVSDEVRSVIVREKYVATLKDIRGKADVNIPDAELKASVDKLYQQQTGEAGEAPETPAAQ
ncbi:peptidylprolyl isomerase [Nitratireductor aestuarii]|uniref:Parvulin-like PPIase n=1 Tax=Nitratireductor aestuarii TaxID=1735103 RepID=A0A916RMY2_9HYPH|nr:peptidylprolyl isomerase [Nitratireductor aestuarii]GGA62487.1 peptidylprolyl isomerase [Nitratireductor aestuarii]